MSAADTFEIDQRRPEKSAWLRHWDWFFVLSVAWLLFDLFMQPVLSICIASFKFGWNDFANGFWLWRKDSERPRSGLSGLLPGDRTVANYGDNVRSHTTWPGRLRDLDWHQSCCGQLGTEPGWRRHCDRCVDDDCDVLLCVFFVVDVAGDLDGAQESGQSLDRFDRSVFKT